MWSCQDVILNELAGKHCLSNQIGACFASVINMQIGSSVKFASQVALVRHCSFQLLIFFEMGIVDMQDTSAREFLNLARAFMVLSFV